MRRADRLNLPDGYFGNAIDPSFASSFSHDVLMHAPLWQVATPIHKVRVDKLIHGAIDAQEMERATRWIAVQPDKNRITVDYGNFTVSQWAAFDMAAGVRL